MTVPHTLQHQLANSILTARCRERMAAQTPLQQLIASREELTPDQHITLVGKLLAEHRERRQRTEPIATERRGRNTQRNGWEDQSDVATAFAADRIAQKD